MNMIVCVVHVEADRHVWGLGRYSSHHKQAQKTALLKMEIKLGNRFIICSEYITN